MSADKGQKGYRNARKKRLIIWLIIFSLAIIIQLAARNFTDTAAARNILTVMAALTVLPAANIASPLLAAWKYQQPGEDFYQEIAVFEDKVMMLHELIITSKEFILPADAIAIHPQGILVYCSNGKADTTKAERFLNEMLSGHRLDLSAKVIKDRKAFIRRLGNLKPASEYDADTDQEEAILLLKALSM